MKSFFKKEKDSDCFEEERRRLFDETDVQNVARVIGMLFFIFPLFLLFLTFFLEISPFADKVEIFVRNISSVIALFILGGFFDLYYRSYHDFSSRVMRSFKAIVVFLAIAGIIKVLISVYYLIICIISGNMVLWFYLGEIIIWTAVSVFAVLYRKRLDIGL